MVAVDYGMVKFFRAFLLDELEILLVVLLTFKEFLGLVLFLLKLLLNELFSLAHLLVFMVFDFFFKLSEVNLLGKLLI